MTVSDCITYIDSIEPNAYTAEQKAMWLSECEGKVYTELFLVQPYEFSPVRWDADADRTLAIPAPYDRLYPRYLQAMIHYANGEYDRYANSMAVFNEVWALLNRWFGGDYDVTDRRRNRRITAEISPELGEQAVVRIPEGCAVAAGRIVVAAAFSRDRTAYVAPEELPAGTYSGMRDDGNWFNWDFDLDIPAKTRLWLGTTLEYLLPGEVSPTGIVPSAGKAGTELDFSLTAKLGDLRTVDLTARGSSPLPMLLGERGGSEVTITLGPGNWKEAGRLLFTGHLLIPDEEFPFN